MSKLTQEEKRIRLAKACGVQPQWMWRVFYDNARQTGAVRIRTRDAAVIRAENERQSAERLNYPCEVSDPEEYDDYDHAPDYFGDLAAALGAVKHAVTELLDEDQVTPLGRLVAGRYASDTLFGSDEEVHYAFANMLAGLAAADYAEPLGQALGLWKEGE